MQYFIANWKSHKNKAEVEAWFGAMLRKSDKDGVEVIVCPASIHIGLVKRLINETGLSWKVGAQDVSPFPYGKYTGAVTAEMIKDYGKYVIVGHSERREYFGETNQDVVNKVEQCLASGLTPVVCVDEPYARSQLLALKEEWYGQILVAYEPLAAIGSGLPDSVEHAGEVMKMIAEVVGQKCPILYGGSVAAGNAREFWEIEVLSGFLVGNTSLDPNEWKALVEVTRS